MDKNEILRRLPKVDEVLAREELREILQSTGRSVVTSAVREVMDDIREGILTGCGGCEAGVEGEILATDAKAVAECVAAKLRTEDLPGLRRVINASGVVLHTNLGRARLADAAAKAAAMAGGSYTTLEYDLETGSRGYRNEYLSGLLAEILGAEAAMVVNNNAAATMLCLAALANGKEVPVSRGELVEIGGSFRIPEIMETSGAKLVEIGTTNKTHLSDYTGVIGPETGAIMKVHTSNYRISGFTSDVSLPELAELARKTGLPLIHDLGSGLLIDLNEYGVNEPTVFESLAQGADVVLFSGDKLMGGAQAGVIAGKKEYIDRMENHPLARALRIDKMTIAALEQTFRIYRDRKHALRDIPILRMITMGREELREKGEKLVTLLSEVRPDGEFLLVDAVGRVGGGSAPMLDLASKAVFASVPGFSASDLELALRRFDVPIIARINEDRLLLDLRTIWEDEFPIVGDAFASLSKGGEGERSE